MAFRPVTDEEILLLRQVIIRALGLPRERVGLVFIVDQLDDEGSGRQMIGCLGMSEAGLKVALYDALQKVMTDSPDQEEIVFVTKPD